MTTDSLPSLLYNRNYIAIITGRASSLIGGSIGLFAAPLIAFNLTHSVVASGAVVAVGEIGTLVGLLPAGYMADHFDRRFVLSIFGGLAAAAWTIAAVLALRNELSAVHLAIVLLLSSAMTVVNGPSESASLRRAVAVEQLPAAQGAMQARSAVAATASGPLGGLLFGLGLFLPLFAAALGNLGSAILGATLSREVSVSARTSPKAPFRTEVLGGLRFVATHRVLRSVFVVLLVINLVFGSTLVGINLYFVNLGTNPILIGTIDFAAGLSMFAGAVVSGRVVRAVPTGRIITVGLTGFFVCVVAMSWLHSLVACMIFVSIAIFFVPPMSAALGGYQATITPKHMQGRVGAVLILASALVTPLAPLLAAFLLHNFGLMPTSLVLSFPLLAVAVFVWRFSPLARVGTAADWALPTDQERPEVRLQS